VTLVRLEQPVNALLPILVTLLGIFMLVRLVQSENTPASIRVTLEFGSKITLCSLVQPENALLPILVTLLGMVMLAREVQP